MSVKVTRKEPIKPPIEYVIAWAGVEESSNWAHARPSTLSVGRVVIDTFAPAHLTPDDAIEFAEGIIELAKQVRG